ncbi:hypothetical protein ACA910_019998 [Epithemia clementina (nom. ined.)]
MVEMTKAANTNNDPRMSFLGAQEKSVDTENDDSTTVLLPYPKDDTGVISSVDQHDDDFESKSGCQNIGQSHPNFSWKRAVASRKRSRSAVLLLFGSDVCRFELLALQSISEKARVTDIFEHIANCKDRSLREQSYRGILVAATEKLLSPESFVASHCGKRNSILVAVPEQGSLIECTRNAIRLLSDPLIDYNLALHDFDAKGWITKGKKRVQFLCSTDMTANGKLQFLWNSPKKQMNMNDTNHIL